MTNSHERWDVVIKALNGPMVSMGEQVFRGPIVRLGANPGPGGIQLSGYRGIDARQCVITAYKGGTAAVAPVGSNQVRVAPHSNVKWKEIDPIPGPVHLTDGCALHLGPVGRGATLEFVECRRLGTWQQGALASEVDQTSGVGAAVGPGGVPQSYDVRSVGLVSASTAPFWFVGCMGLMSTVAVSLLVMIGGYLLLVPDIAPLGPEVEGYEFYRSVDISTTEIDTDLYDGLQKPFYEFVMVHNIEQAGRAHPGLANPENWDQQFLKFTTASLQQHVKAWSVFRSLDRIKEEYSTVALMLRESGLPEVMAAIPYQESRYDGDIQSWACAKGWWQFMPEVALRVERQGGFDFKVRDCRFIGRSDFKWSPTELSPPSPIRTKSDYVQDDQCIIERCDIDQRTDLQKATRAAIFTLKEAYEDKTLKKSGSIVQITIASHNGGYDDSRFRGGREKRVNVLPAYKRYVSKYGEAKGPHFYGANILAPDWESPSWHGSELAAETQHYAYSTVAFHLLAVCYYATNYPEDRAFKSWRSHVTSSDGYCREFDIPSAEDVRRRRRAK